MSNDRIITHWHGRAIKAAKNPASVAAHGCDWSAWLDGLQEVGPTGHGATEAAARRDLLDDLVSGWVPADGKRAASEDRADG